MLDARRPYGWLFLLLAGLVALAVSAQTLPTTTISDTVYRADGTPAGGTLLISWPDLLRRRWARSRREIPVSRWGLGGLCRSGWFRTQMLLRRIRFTPSFIHYRESGSTTLTKILNREVTYGSE